MAFKKKDHLVGLDIGSSLIKVAELKNNGKEYVLKKFGVQDVPHDAIEDGNIKDAEGVAEAIRALFKAQKIRKKNIAVSTGGASVVIKTISVPIASEKELQDSIWFEAEQYIPYDIEDVNVDFQILGTSEFSEEQMNVLLVAVKKDIVAEYIDLVNLAGLNPCVIDVDTFALQNIYEVINQGDKDKITMLVDIGASKISINILKGKSSLLTRDSSFGTFQIIEEIVSETDCTVEEAEKMLAGSDAKLAALNKVKEITIEVVKEWCSEILSVISTYQSKSSEGDVEKIVLCGGGASVNGFSQTLASEISADVSIFNPFKGMIINNKRFSPSFLSRMAPLAPIAFGLALRKMDDK